MMSPAVVILLSFRCVALLYYINSIGHFAVSRFLSGSLFAIRPKNSLLRNLKF